MIDVILHGNPDDPTIKIAYQLNEFRQTIRVQAGYPPETSERLTSFSQPNPTFIDLEYVFFVHDGTCYHYRYSGHTDRL